MTAMPASRSAAARISRASCTTSTAAPGSRFASSSPSAALAGAESAPAAPAQTAATSSVRSPASTASSWRPASSTPTERMLALPARDSATHRPSSARTARVVEPPMSSPSTAVTSATHLPSFSQYCWISSRRLPFVSGACRCTNTIAARASTPNTANVPAPPRPFSIVRKTAATIALATRSAVSIALAPGARSRAGKDSPAYTHTREPKPNVNPTVNSTSPTKPSTVSTPPNEEESRKTTISSTFATTMIPMPVSRVGLRPKRSTVTSEVSTAARPNTCTSAGRPSRAALPVKPIDSKIRGL